MRAFVALDIPEAVRRAVGEAIRKLALACPAARWARVAGMHVTLKFISEAAPEQVERIKTELAGARSRAAVEVGFRGTGFFPNPRHPRVLWVGMEASPNLAELAAEIEKRMERLGIPREDRAFKPHLTLARFKSEEGLAKLHEALTPMGHTEFGSMRTEEFHLYQSTLRRGGAEYAKLQTFRFVEHR